MILKTNSGDREISFNTQHQLCPEPLAHHTVNVKVEAGVEDNEDMVEVGHTEPKARYRMPTSLATHGDSIIISLFVKYYNMFMVLPLFIQVIINDEYFVQFG